MRVGNDNRVGRRMSRRVIDMEIRMRRRSGTIIGNRGVKFASVIQMSHRKRVNNYITIKLGSLHIIGEGVAKPSSACVISKDARHNPRPSRSEEHTSELQ